MFHQTILLKSEPSGIILFFVALLFFGPTLFVFTLYIKSKLNKSKYVLEFIELAAFVISSDGNILQKEINYVHYFLEKQFGNRKLNVRKKALATYLKGEK